MKKLSLLLLTFLIALSGIMVYASSASATNSLGTQMSKELTAFGDAAGAKKQDLSVTVGKIINAALGIFGTILVVLMVYGGFLWMTAGGEEQKVTKAKDIIKNAIIGLVIVLAAYSIATFVLTSLITATGGA